MACVIRSGFMWTGWESFGCRSFLQNSFVRKLSTFYFLSNIFISLDFLCPSFSASCRQLLRTHWALPVCGTCSVGLPSRVLQDMPLTLGTLQEIRKKLYEFCISKTFFPRSTTLSFNIHLYLFLMLGSDSDGPSYSPITVSRFIT